MNRIIVALDVCDAEEARTLIKGLGPEADFYKIGFELYAAAGMNFVREALDSFGKKVFLDLKLHDIGETVFRATKEICRQNVTFLTVHARPKVMSAALRGRGSAACRLLGVTILTDLEPADLVGISITELLDRRVRQALDAGVDGVVCSPLEAARVRELAGPKLTIVTPGVRSSGAALGDQKRVATPREAIENGADYVVVGRQITHAAKPREAFDQISREIG